jgi:hypothetical protein
MVEEANEVIDECLQCILAIADRTLPVSPHVIGYDIMGALQFIDLGLPHFPAEREPVDEDDGYSGPWTVDIVGDVYAANGNIH